MATQYLVESVAVEDLPELGPVVDEELASRRNVSRGHCEHVRPPVDEHLLKVDVLLPVLEIYSRQHEKHIREWTGLYASKLEVDVLFPVLARYLLMRASTTCL